MARLQLVAQIITNALARKRADEARSEMQQRLSLAADAAGAGFWVLDVSTQVFWATPLGADALRLLAGGGRQHGPIQSVGSCRGLGPCPG